MPVVEESSVQSDLPNIYEATPADFRAVERILEIVEANFQAERALLTFVTQWFTALEIFRRIELHHTQGNACGHKDLLERLIRAGDSILEALKLGPAVDFSAIDYSFEDVKANQQFLLGRRELWYSPIDQERADRFLGLIYGETC